MLSILQSRLLTPLLFAGLFIAQLAAQNSTTHFSKNQQGWWTLGINAGTAYQTSDVCTDPRGWGAGLTLGKNLFYRPTAPVSFDLRGRFLVSKSYGADAVRSFGLAKNSVLNGQSNSNLNYLLDQNSTLDSSFVFQNYRNTAAELGLEGVLTFNRLRQRTGVVFSLFGGIGLDAYSVQTDQLGSDGKIYNYLKINENANSRSIRADLDVLRDGDFETDADGFQNSSTRFGLMPNLGVELGYQLTPNFYAGIGHKLTFTRTDIFDGSRWNNDNSATGDNDLHHYTNLFLRWDIQPARRERRQQPPTIDITEPSTDPYVSDRREVEVWADIRHVRSAADVLCLLNGSNQRFQYKNGRFRTQVRLENGRNEVRIKATNPDGRAEAATIIIFQEKYVPPTPPVPPIPPVPTPPMVDFVEPSYSPAKVDRDEKFVIARVAGIRDRRELRFFVNGYEQTNFNLAENFEASVRLREGRNLVRLEAETASGRAADEVEIIFEKPQPLGERPVVMITNPSRQSETTREANFNFRAVVRNVDFKDDISLTVNGLRQSDFSFNSRSGEVAANISLKNGENSITLRAQNRVGSDEKTATLTKIGGIDFPKKPVVDITSPADGSTSQQQNIDLRANLKNIAAAGQLSVLVNGSEIYNFNFDPTGQTVVAPVRLLEGNNSLTIKAVNQDGRDEETVNVRFEKAKNPPTVQITAPADNSTTNQPMVELRAALTNVSEASQISVFANRRQISDFRFDRRANSVSANVALSEGANSLIVKVQNADGSDEESVNIRFEKRKTPPTVQILSPADGSSTRNENAKLTAKIENVSSPNDVEVRVNKSILTNFAFDGNGNLSADLKLAPGKNTIIVSAKNSDGSDQKSVEVNFLKGSPSPNPPVAVPTVKIVSASSPAVDLNNPTVFRSGVVAELKNVSEKSQIKVRVNGKDFPNFEFNARAGWVKFTVVLAKGDNVVEVSATTPAGTASDSTNVLLK